MNRKPGTLYTAFIFLLFVILPVTSGCYLDDRDNVFDARSNNYYKIDYVAKETAWTFMVFAGADNNLEQDILLDINEMQQGMKNVDGINLIVFIDRSPDWSNDKQILGENFAGGKIFRVTGSKIYELYGQEFLPECMPQNFFNANSGDAELLQKFVQFSKTYYPANKYALVISSHGGGAAKRSVLPVIEKSADGSSTRDVSVDETSEDRIYTAEITDDLTAAESVDLLGYDACLMGSVEVAYQYRPGNGSFEAEVMVASPASEWNYGWDYTAVFQRFAGTGENINDTNDGVGDPGTYEQYFDAETIETLEFGGIIVEEYYDQYKNNSSYLASQTMSCYDLSHVEDVKTAVDTLAKQAFTFALKDDFLGLGFVSFSSITTAAMNYCETISDMPNDPFFDLYDFLQVASNTIALNALSVQADTVAGFVDNLVVYSFGGSDYVSTTGTFQQGKNGIHIYFPYKEYFKTNSGWYSPLSVSSAYGLLSWCIDGIDEDTGEVGNWFELLDIWMDESTDSNGYTP